MFLRSLLAALLASAAMPVFSQAAKDASNSPGAKPPAGTPVRAVAARVGIALDEASAVGSLRADESVVLRPEIAGRIVQMPFAEGQAVTRGAKLVALDSAEVRAQLASTVAQAKLDAQRLERSEDLFKKKFISQQALDEARSNYVRSVAKQHEDEARLAKSEVRAPFTGVVGLRQVSEGAFVAAGTDIARLEKIDQLKLDFRIPELYLARLKTGQAVRIAVDAYPNAEFAGAIYAIEPAIEETTRTVQVRARIANEGLKLRPGMFARVSLRLGAREQAVWVPEQAIVPRGQDAFVFRVVAGKADLVQVQTGVRKVGEVEILKGIAAGDMVVTEGNQKIGPGAPVTVLTPQTVKPAAAASNDRKG